MSAKIILHVGTHKTGTTSIQHYCRRNQENLLKQGVLYPDYDLVGFNHYKRAAHHELTHAIASKSTKMDINDVKNYIKKIKQYDGKVILSAEPFSRHVISVDKNISLWAKKEHYVQLVSELFGADVEICFVLRNHYDFAKSVYQERVKKTRETRSFLEFIFSDDARLDYYRNISLWEKYFDKVHVLDFDSLLEQNNLEEAFLNYFGVNTINFSRIDRKNDSLPKELVLFKRLINAMPLTNDTVKKITTQLLNVSSHNSICFSNKDEFDYAKTHDIERFYKKHEKSHLILQEKYPNLESINIRKRYSPVFPGLSEELYLTLLKKYVI